MLNTLTSEVPIFASGVDVHIWLSRLDSYYKLYVLYAKDDTGVMERHFVQCALGRICSEYLHPMMADDVTMETYDDMKNYLKQNHASQVTIFQTMDTLWDLDKTESETLRDYGIRLDDKAAEAVNIICAKRKEWLKEAKDPKADTAMSPEEMMKLVSGQVFLQYLKRKDRMVYNNICNDLDKTWTAADISNKAMMYSDRLAPDESQNQGSVPQGFSASKMETRLETPTEVCRTFIKYGCTKPDCPRIHDEKLRDMFEEKNTRLTEHTKSDKKKKKHWGNGNKPASNTVMSDTVVPLPTGVFRQ